VRENSTMCAVMIDLKEPGEGAPVSRPAVNECVSILRRRLCGGITQPLQALPLLPDNEVNRK
jgi:hypothetical protein